jgi:nucleotide-binding universal stress UspA family protein
VAGGKEVKMKSIVLAYDGSEAAKRALERTAELANGAAVTVVSAVHVMPPAGRAGVTVDQDEVEERRGELAEASSFLESKGIKSQTVELHAMDIGKAVVDQAKEGGADLIVVGTGQKNVAQRLILGSVSTKVVHEANCDVLVVR